jgi:subtilisin
MAPEEKVQQYILLPNRGLRVTEPTTAGRSIGRFLNSVESVLSAPGSRLRTIERAPTAVRMRVIDSIHEDGAKLVEMPPGSVQELRAYQPGVRIVPVVYFRPARAPQFRVSSAPRAKAARATASITITVRSASDHAPVSGAFVVAFTDFQDRVGAQGTTRTNGQVALALGASSKKLERMYVYPKLGFWGALKRSITITTGSTIDLTPVDLAYQDALRHFYGSSPTTAGAGLIVGVIDTGIDLHHPDLTVAGGENTVPGEDPADYGDNGEGHGTHVGGIIAAHGTPPTGIRGLAPGVALRSYRVFGEGSDQASNYAIAKAIDRAVADGCHLLNLSLGGGDPDEATSAAIQDAWDGGTVALIASGNDGRGPVSFPASDSLALAISGMGRKGTFPSGTVEGGDVRSPYGTDRSNFVAAFSNVGPQIDLTCTGVGILSTVPGGYAPMDGTSMASPAATGVAARVLAKHPDILGMPPDASRADAIAQAVLRSGRRLGFGATYEGHGLPRGVG